MPHDDEKGGVLKRLRKGVKKRARKEKQKRAKREIKRRKRRAKRKDLAEDVKDIASASRAGEAVRGARRAGGAAVSGAKAAGRGLERLDETLEKAGTGELEGELAAGELNVTDLKTELMLVSNRRTLRRLLRAERSGRDRSSAKRAIRQRIEDLEDGADQNAAMETVGDFLGVDAPDEPIFGGGDGGARVELADVEMDPLFDDDDGGSGKEREKDSFGLDF